MQEQEFKPVVELIEWAEPPPNQVAWLFPRYDRPIAHKAELIVRESQCAVFMHEQVAGDVFKPGRHELEAARLELFAGASVGGDDAEAPFACDVVFVSMRQFLEWKWHTREPIVMRDEAFGPVRTRAQGTCNFRIHDPALFVQGMRRCTRDFWPDDIDRALQDILVNSVATALEEAPLPISKLAANDADLADWLLQTVRPGFHAAGVEISKACPQSISLPPEIEQELRTRYRG